MIKTLSLFILTALAEIIGCWLPYLWLRQSKSAWLIMPAAASLAAFTYLLTLHPAASGRIYAAYSGVYISIALLWLRFVDGMALRPGDYIGAALCFAGAAVIAWGSVQAA
ncbi:YnfA family protein [Kingella kingae]|uniref:YnfA family protein n=1 Tax=Kingella kingae TaxID=504 RepID=UPI00025888D7|nr:YnfA family protein [Kingella kingae]EIC14550.1 hypothetical protein KKB_00322 [Kingella kingae PYKK081]MBD3613817.1 YnfA family protein [Kingella kingae]MBD3632068.1 YnfA family protein [Kingella kingae]MBD3659405.1 YnfA family protein [Kingella kingae]MDK4568696.1 YnfA family protein [Kingella kingae]